jgi:hypothetical protein
MRSLPLDLIRRFSSSSLSPAAVADAYDLPRFFQEAIDDKVCQTLASDGYACVDSILPTGLTSRLRSEVLSLYQQGAMHQNHTHLLSAAGSAKLLAKQAIHEAEITMDAAIQAKAPLCSRFQDDSSLRVLLSLHLPFLTLGSSATKLQVNTGGSFPLHLDSDEAHDMRRITAIFYLNPPSPSAQGGQLRLYPWPSSAPIDIDPINNRLVLFSSTRMLHRVLPFQCNQESDLLRVCFTVWLSAVQRRQRRVPGSSSSSPKQTLSSMLSSATREERIKALLHPEIRQHVLRLVYEDEWRQSIEQSHPEGEGRSMAIQDFDSSIQKIRAALSQHLTLIEEISREGYQKVQWLPA